MSTSEAEAAQVIDELQDQVGSLLVENDRLKDQGVDSANVKASPHPSMASPLPLSAFGEKDGVGSFTHDTVAFRMPKIVQTTINAHNPLPKGEGRVR
jgi:hypothetical protein